MARVNVETRALAEQRFNDLREDLKFRRYEALGLLTILWHDSQERLLVSGTRDEIKSFLDVQREKRDEVFEALVRNQYLTQLKDGTFEVRGNRRHVEFLKRQKSQGKLGGKNSGISRRLKPSLHSGEPFASDAEPNAMQCKAKQGNAEQFNAMQNKAEKNLVPHVAKATKGGSPVWDAYSRAYQARYRTDPVRNAMINGQLGNLVKRLGAEDAPLVAAFFVQHNDAFYVRTMHPVGILLKDAEKLRTEWATGRRVLGSQARETERMAHNQNSFDQAADLLRKKREADDEREPGQDDRE